MHTAGPFQQAEKCTVLEAAIQTKVRKGNHHGICMCLFAYFIYFYLKICINYFSNVLSRHRQPMLMFVMIQLMHGVQNPSRIEH